MKKHVGLIGSVVLGVVFVTAGLSGNFAVAGVDKELKADLKELKSELKDLKGDVKDHIDKKGPSNRVPEPSSLILLGAGLAGLGIWAWRKKPTKV